MKKNAFCGIFFYPYDMKVNKSSLFIDIGASFIKTHPLELMFPTPKNCKPADLFKILSTIKIPANYKSVYVGFPGVVVNGITVNAPNLSNKSWQNYHLEKKLRALFRRRVFVINDADLHGLKVVKGKGVELVVALGTGVGSAIFIDNKLLPNLELGHAPFCQNKSYEEILGLKNYRRIAHRKWESYLLQAITNWKRLFNPACIYLTGGLSLSIRNPKILSSVKIIGNP